MREKTQVLVIWTIQNIWVVFTDPTASGYTAHHRSELYRRGNQSHNPIPHSNVIVIAIYIVIVFVIVVVVVFVVVVVIVIVCSGSLVVTAYDFESGRPGSSPEWGLIYY